MTNRIEVYIDIYRNHFKNAKHQLYVYANVIAVNPEQQTQVNNIITIMAENNSSLLLNKNMILPTNSNTLIEKSRKCFLNTNNLCFEFE